MNRKVYYLVLLGVFFCSAFQGLMAQGELYKKRPLWLGINFGAAWENSDVRSRLGYGAGATLEKSLVYNNRSILGMSIRGRYLFSSMSGLDTKRSYGISNNDVLNGTYGSQTDYTSSLGYIYHNYKTTNHEVDLELLINTNRLRAKHGVNLYMFGGVGYLGHRTYVNQLDEYGNQYDYSAISTSKNFVAFDLRTTLDNDYETPSESGPTRKFYFAPSLGAGISLRAAHNLYVGFEHKITYPKTDLLDGQRWNEDNTLSGDNDLYHYSNMYLNIGLFGKGYMKSAVKPSIQPPTIVITYPTTEIVTVVDCRASIMATLTNVDQRSSIEVRQDGISIEDFDFNASTGALSISKTIERNSTFVISVTNGAGRINRSVQFNCTPIIKEVPPPVIIAPKPEVYFIFPVANPYVSGKCTEEIVALVKNISKKEQIKVVINNITLFSSEYTFNNATQEVIIPRKFNGPILVQVFVQNDQGKASASTELRCSPNTVTFEKPQVKILTPSESPYFSVSCGETITAFVKNVSTKENISVTLNGLKLSNESVVFNKQYNQVVIKTTFSERAELEIVVRNNAGTASDKLILECKKIAPPRIFPPMVTINKPSTSPYLSLGCNEEIVATINNVQRKMDINVSVNGLALSPSYFSFDDVSGRLSFYLPIEVSAFVLIVATNDAGSATDDITINCKQTTNTIPPPIVQIVNPTSNPFVSISCEEDIIAIVKNVERKDDIEVIVDGLSMASSTYSFDPMVGKLVFHARVKGTKSILIKAKNESGVASDAINITCSPAVVLPPPPLVNFTKPSVTPFTSISCEETIIALVKNVSGKENIQIIANGTLLADNAYSFDKSTGVVTFQIHINKATQVTINVLNEVGSANDAVTINCIPPVETPAVIPPTVVITKPSTKPYISVSCEEDIKAIIKNVKSKDEIEISVNGLSISPTQYSFDLTTGQLIYHIKIKEVRNISIIATNASGTASDNVTITCKPLIEIPVVIPPTVIITKPTSTTYVSAGCEEDVVASIKNIKEGDKIRVSVNGLLMATSQYSVDFTTGVLIFPMKIKGSSNVVIMAINSSGEASDNVTITCTPTIEEPVVIPPTVAITKPTTTPYVSAGCEEDIKATIKNVKSKEEITLTADGLTVSPTLYSFDLATGFLIYHTTIREKRVVVITATNASGTASDNVTITCTPPIEEPVVIPPTVTITKPSTTPYVSAGCEEDIKATIKNVKSKEEITVTADGLTVSPTLYSFDLATGFLIYHTTIREKRVVVITATNASGTASDNVTITCTPPIEEPVVIPPTVTITKPSTTPYVSAGCEEDIKATIKNVKSKEEITVTADGLTVSPTLYSFDLATGFLIYHTTIREKRVVVITATNTSGTASDNVTITCAPPVETPVIIEIPYFPLGTDCPSTSPSRYIDCASCNFSEQDATNNNLVVESGKKVCIRENYFGQITMNGGTLVVCGKATPSSLNFNSGTIIINGEAVFGSININTTEGTIRNFGKFTASAFSFAGRFENYGNAIIQGDCNVNSSGIFKNTGEFVAASFNNNNKGCNTGTMTISRDFKNNGSANFINGCKIYIENEFHNNGIFDNDAYVNVEAKVYLNGGNFTMNGGSKLRTTNLVLNSYINGGSSCASITVLKETLLNGSAGLANSVGICDLNGIEQNNIRLAVNCDCEVSSSSCVPYVEGNDKVSICHLPPGNTDNGQNISVSRSALKAHLDHGDHLGACTEEDQKRDKGSKNQDDDAIRIQKEREEKERLEKEKQDREQKEKDEAERVQKDREEKERLEKENQEREQKEKDEAERIQKEREEKERLEKEKQEREQKEKEATERVQKEREEKERLEKENQERVKKEKDEAERIQKEREEKERLEKENQERVKKEKDEAERIQKEREEKERLEKEKQEREQKEKDEAEQIQKEREEKERLEKDVQKENSEDTQKKDE